MIRFFIIRASVIVVAVGLVAGWTQTGQAQCQNGTCRAAASSGTVVVASANPTPAASKVTVNAQPTTIGQPVYCDSVNNCGYASIPSGTTYSGCWSSCNSCSNVVYSNVQYAPVQYPTHYSTSNSCSGGTCNVR